MPVLKIKKNGSWVEVWGATNSGSSGIADVPKLAKVLILANAWTGNNNPYSQSVTINGVGANSKLDLQPTPDQIVSLQDSEISLMLTNDNGVITAWAIGNKPTKDYVMDVLITEVTIV